MKSKSKCFDGLILNYGFMGLQDRPPAPTCFPRCPLRARDGRRAGGGDGRPAGPRRGELITWGEGSLLSPGWMDAPYLRDGFGLTAALLGKDQEEGRSVSPTTWLLPGRKTSREAGVPEPAPQFLCDSGGTDLMCQTRT